jgi:hypothetical protein
MDSLLAFQDLCIESLFFLPYEKQFGLEFYHLLMIEETSF